MIPADRRLYFSNRFLPGICLRGRSGGTCVLLLDSARVTKRFWLIMHSCEYMMMLPAFVLHRLPHHVADEFLDESLLYSVLLHLRFSCASPVENAFHFKLVLRENINTTYTRVKRWAVSFERQRCGHKEIKLLRQSIYFGGSSRHSSINFISNGFHAWGGMEDVTVWVKINVHGTRKSQPKVQMPGNCSTCGLKNVAFL